MRIRLTLDPDVTVLLERGHARGAALKDVANQGLRLGLKQMTQEGRGRAACPTEAVSLGRCLVGEPDHVAQALAGGEGDAFR